MRCGARVSILLLAIACVVRGADAVPQWVRDAAAQNLPKYDAKVPGVYLLWERQAEVEENGRVTVTVRTVYKVLTREGRAETDRAEPYLRGVSKIREFKAWMLGPSGEPLKLLKENEYDRAYLQAAIYDDVRLHGFNARDKADPGSVFAVEATIEDKAVFDQFEFYFQHRDPVLTSRFLLTLPAGWQAESVTFNHAEIRPSMENGVYRWETRELPHVEVEPSSPQMFSLVPRLAVSYFPADKKTSFTGVSFRTWQDVSRWATAVTDAQATPGEDVIAKAKELTAQSQNDWERIRAVAKFVQRTKYVAIALGVGRIGGYQPKAAEEVLGKEYGDCKDKATLIRALLKALGIESYMVLVNSRDRSYVQAQWPSPQQFNHAIVAIKTTPPPVGAPLVDVPDLGRLLLFDPTAGNTPLGDLPTVEQGGSGLVLAGNKGKLVQLPFITSTSGVERELAATVDERGTLRAKFTDKAQGQQAAADRAILYSRGPQELRNTIERWIATSVPGAQIEEFGHQDRFDDGRFEFRTAFQSSGYGQMRANRLMIFKPVIVGRWQVLFLTEKQRTEPVLLNPTMFHELDRIQLPGKFKVDELPNPESFETPFGKYTATCQAKEGELIFDRTLEIRPAAIPVAEYAAVREFYERIVNAEQSPVVLIAQ